MRHATHIGRLTMLVTGLGIGAALAWTPGVALADPSTTLTPTEIADIDKVLVALLDPSGAPIQVSINGMDLFPTDGNTATATSAMGDIAIAVGDGANATSGQGLLGILGSGIGDLAFADGTNSTADAALVGGANLDFVFADGANSFANAGLGANLDIASAVGTGSSAEVAVGDSLDGAFADGTDSLAKVGLGNLDLATALGTGSNATAGVGNADLAAAFNGSDANASGFDTTAFANGANSDATGTGGILDSAFANGGGDALANGDLDTAIVSGANAEATAINGIHDLAFVVNTGSAMDEAVAGGTGAILNDNDIAEIFGTGSTAFAGSDPTTAGSFDLAAVFGDMLNAMATGKDFLIDILPSLF
jgi:hypothetical protein